MDAAFLFEKAPFPSCHASSVAEVEPGRLLATWFGGTAEKAKDVKIWLARFDGKCWSAPELMAEEPNTPTWNPVLFRTARKALHLWYKAGPDPMSWTGFRRTSQDLGKTWGKSEMLPAGFFGPVRAKPLQLADGTLLAGTSVEGYRAWTCYVDRSGDEGITWTRHGPLALAGGAQKLIQPSLVELGDGKILAVMRASNVGRICQSISGDGGKTWSVAEPIEALPNPNSGIDCVRTRSGTLWMVYNHTLVGRTPLNLARSDDGGKTWTPKVLTLENEFGEYSYPAVIESEAGLLEIAYTWKRTHIKHARVDPKSVK